MSGQSDVRIVRNGDNYVIHMDGQVITATGIDSITFDGSNLDDLLIVDFSAGNPIPAEGLFYNGYDNGPAGDAITLQGGAFSSSTYNYFNPTDGTIDIDGWVITYTGLEPIIDTVPAVNLTIYGTNVNNVITYENDGGNGRVAVDNYETISFANKANLIVYGLGGNDIFDLVNSSLPPSLTSLTINAGAGSDVVNLLESPMAIVDLYGNEGDDILNVKPSTTAAISVDGGTSFNGDVLDVAPWVSGTIDTGSILQIPGYQNISYVNVEQILSELADLRITKLCMPDENADATPPGVDAFMCTLYVDNLGPSSANRVSIRDEVLSDGTIDLVRTNLDPNRNDQGPFLVSAPEGGMTMEFDLLETLEPQNIQNEGRWVVQYFFQVPDTADVNNCVDVFTRSGGTTDPDTSNNHTCESIHVSAVADLTLNSER